MTMSLLFMCNQFCDYVAARPDEFVLAALLGILFLVHRWLVVRAERAEGPVRAERPPSHGEPT